MLNVVLLGKTLQVVTAIYIARTTTEFLTTAPERIPQMMKMKKATITRLIDNLLDTANQDAETNYMLHKHIDYLQRQRTEREREIKKELDRWAKAYDKQTFELCEANKKIKELSAKNKSEVKKDG